jgi:hypothetical protein
VCPADDDLTPAAAALWSPDALLVERLSLELARGRYSGSSGLFARRLRAGEDAALALRERGRTGDKGALQLPLAWREP